MTSLADAIVPRIAEIEQGRRVPLDLVHDLADRGLFRLWLPHELGGEQADLRRTIEVIEDVARIDGSTGWIVMIGLTTGLLAGYLPPDLAEQVYGDRRGVTGGVVQPAGRGARVDGGYRVSGRWPFASGCEHCGWLVGGTVVDGDDAVKLMVFPASDVEIVDSWDVVGLRGTGSHDIAVHDAFVPESRAVSLFAPIPYADGPLHRMPIPTPLGVALAAVPLGIAAGALDDVVALATAKTPAMSRSTLAQRAIVQIELAQAEVELRAARAALLESADALWAAAAAGRPDDRTRAFARSAAIHATTTAASVVDRAYTLGGGTALRAGSPLQRRLRDVHAATQHALVSRAALEPIGRLILGLPADTALF